MADVSKLFDKGEEAFKRRNYDYAIQIYQQVLAIDPDHFGARKQILGSMALKAQAAGAGGSASSASAAITKGFGFLSTTLTGLTKKWDQQIQTCMSHLKSAPDDKDMLIKLAHALESQGHNNGALAVFEHMRERDRKNLDALRGLGRLYRATDNPSKSAECYEALMREVPHDQEASKAVRDLAALKANLAIHTAQDKGEGNYRDLIKTDTQKAAKSERMPAQRIRTQEDLDAAIQELREAVVEEPKNKQLFKDLGELLVKAKDWAGAQEVYKQALELDPSDNQVKDRLGEIPIKQAEAVLGQLSKALKANPRDPTNRKKYQEFTAKLTALRAREWTRRTQVYPTDVKLRFELGCYLYAAKKMDEAIACFQKTVNEPRLTQDTHIWLGKCFREKGQFDFAVREFEKASGDATEMTDKLKEITYELACLWERQGDMEKAKEQYVKIYEVDIQYKDVAKKLEALS